MACYLCFAKEPFRATTGEMGLDIIQREVFFSVHAGGLTLQVYRHAVLVFSICLARHLIILFHWWRKQVSTTQFFWNWLFQLKWLWERNKNCCSFSFANDFTKKHIHSMKIKPCVAVLPYNKKSLSTGQWSSTKLDRHSGVSGTFFIKTSCCILKLQWPKVQRITHDHSQRGPTHFRLSMNAWSE